ncbi:uncharacterized protein PAC_04934 [Phialocephala subalpina]|uniref:SprT-like domain-containing protein n=1 Tax=Phialocephala subalpina TaxID=576137 RepID=A0A1L7WQK2_9HELO|nr:uncharacterized protein PAC_04934 [Phialocephala subalpina]
MSRCFLIPERNRNANTWVRFAHDHDEVETKFLDNFHYIDEYDIEQFHEAGLSDLDSKTDDFSPEDEGLLQEYFNNFNDMFFFNTLTEDRCSLRMVSRYDEYGNRDPEWLENQQSDGPEGKTSECRPNKRERSDAFAAITIYQPDFLGDPEHRLRSYIETLLHEMVHAFIIIHTCYCNRYERDFEAEGQHGHGITWHAMTTELEDFVKERLCLEVDLGILTAMAEEWHSTGAELDNVDRRGLGLDEVKEAVDDLRNASQNCLTGSEDDSDRFESSSSEEGFDYQHSGDDESDEESSESSDEDDAYYGD